MNKDQQWIDALQKGDREILGKIYLHHREGFLRYAQRYALPEEELRDIYQDSIIALYENVRQGKLEGLKSSLKTYLYAIGKYKILARLKNSAVSTSELMVEPLADGPEPLETSAAEERQQKLQRAYEQLGPRCREILRRFYYEAQKLEEIREALDYPNRDTVKAQKSRCLKQLKEIVHSHGQRQAGLDQ
ncbi:RNA polymerase sigma factor [Geofilum rhodophaeum]|uniref:RNA polymerase sigma factor n=1 Tax=Geofilum rhodophaeum TaxID=1965019 RepID=UPI000B5211E7|nr:sigma-70 family RNA polymerase sigma factor [Geofilum rhodophaeum]